MNAKNIKFKKLVGLFVQLSVSSMDKEKKHAFKYLTPIVKETPKC